MPKVAETMQRRGERATAARLLGWFVDLLEQTGQTPSPATAEPARATIAQVRSALGSSADARAAGSGAAVRLVGALADARGVAASGQRASRPSTAPSMTSSAGADQPRQRSTARQARGASAPASTSLITSPTRNGVRPSAIAFVSPVATGMLRWYANHSTPHT